MNEEHKVGADVLARIMTVELLVKFCLCNSPSISTQEIKARVDFMIAINVDLKSILPGRR